MRNPGQLPPKLSNRQKKFLKRNLAELGYDSYREYLKGPEWAETRNRYRSSGKLQSCLVCRAPNVDLHHRTYLRLGQERLEDLVALCREHHEALHEEGYGLWAGPRLLYEQERASRSRARRGARGAGRSSAQSEPQASAGSGSSKAFRLDHR
jgi:hypothetical protein